MGKHYIPQYYLQGFSINQTEAVLRIYQYEKGGTESKAIPIRLIAQTQRMWAKETEDYITFNIENPANPFLDSLRREQPLIPEGKEKLSAYLAALIVRVPNMRTILQDIHRPIHKETMDEIDEELKEYGNTFPDLKDKLEEVRKRTKLWSENDPDKIFKEVYENLLQLSSATQKASENIKNMNWHFIVSKNPSFVTGDNPVFFPRDIGLTHRASELSFPLSSRIALIANWLKIQDGKFVVATDRLVKEINRRTILSSRFVYSGTQYSWIHRVWNRR